MKLILTHEVTGLGDPGDIIEVKDGYGRNFLIPRGYAIRWTRGGEKQIAPSSGPEVREIRDLGQAGEVKAPAEGLSVRLPSRRRHGPPVRRRHRRDIADAVSRPGVPLDKRAIEISTPIKTVGSHSHGQAAPRGLCGGLRRGRRRLTATSTCATYVAESPAATALRGSCVRSGAADHRRPRAGYGCRSHDRVDGT